MPSTLDTESEEKETSDSSTIQRATTTTEYNSETTTTESPKNSTENTVTQSAGAYQRYIVRKGDTLVSISKRIYGTQTMVKKIKEANGLSNENQIYPGQKLLVPKSIN
nr:LysM peptidoglycan-binding domain-containing protein [Anaerostipes faecalis]